jgi:hypothetical protein
MPDGAVYYGELELINMHT